MVISAGDELGAPPFRLAFGFPRFLRNSVPARRQRPREREFERRSALGNLSCWWIAVHDQILMNWWICSSKMDELLHHFLANFEKLVQKIVTSGNCLQFLQIPGKIRENFTEKSTISVDLQQNFESCSQKKKEKITKMCENLKNFKCKRCKSLFIL